MPDESSPKMIELLAMAAQRGASDMHLKEGQPPLLRISGDIVQTHMAILTSRDIAALAEQIMTPRSRGELETTGSAEFSFMTDAGDRFRITVYRQRGVVSVAARRVVRSIRTFEDLHLPVATLERISQSRQGLVVFCGTAGSGKSTSIAACLNYINQHRRCHICTLEDPIEFIFEDELAFVDQREIGTDVASFEAALKVLMREDPDVVLVGELRDRAAVTAALRAAETTRLVFTTIHAATAPGAFVRLLDLFPPDERYIIRQSLATNFVAVICQKLLPASDPAVSLVPATEVMVSTPMIRKMIRDSEESHIASILASDADIGMHDFTQDLARLIREEWVDPKVAYEVAPNPEALKMAVRGIDVTKGTLR
jgi:twitching motility protein PilT